MVRQRDPPAVNAPRRTASDFSSGSLKENVKYDRYTSLEASDSTFGSKNANSIVPTDLDSQLIEEARQCIMRYREEKSHRGVFLVERSDQVEVVSPFLRQCEEEARQRIMIYQERQNQRGPSFGEESAKAEPLSHPFQGKPAAKMASTFRSSMYLRKPTEEEPDDKPVLLPHEEAELEPIDTEEVVRIEHPQESRQPDETLDDKKDYPHEKRPQVKPQKVPQTAVETPRQKTREVQREREETLQHSDHTQVKSPHQKLDRVNQAREAEEVPRQEVQRGPATKKAAPSRQKPDPHEWEVPQPHVAKRTGSQSTRSLPVDEQDEHTSEGHTDSESTPALVGERRRLQREPSGRRSNDLEEVKTESIYARMIMEGDVYKQYEEAEADEEESESHSQSLQSVPPLPGFWSTFLEFLNEAVAGVCASPKAVPVKSIENGALQYEMPLLSIQNVDEDIEAWGVVGGEDESLKPRRIAKAINFSSKRLDNNNPLIALYDENKLRQEVHKVEVPDEHFDVMEDAEDYYDECFDLNRVGGVPDAVVVKPKKVDDVSVLEDNSVAESFADHSIQAWSLSPRRKRRLKARARAVANNAEEK